MRTRFDRLLVCDRSLNNPGGFGNVQHVRGQPGRNRHHRPGQVPVNICIIDPSDKCEHDRPQVIFAPSANAHLEAEFAALFSGHSWWHLLKRWHSRHLSKTLERVAGELRQATIRL